MHTKFLIRLLGLWVAVLLFSQCQQDTLLTETPETSQPAAGLPGLEVQQFIFDNLPEKEAVTLALSTFKKSPTARDTTSFTVLTDQVTYLSVGDRYHSYTFQVLREGSSGALENLLVSLQADGTYKSFLITY
uniref:hypothetical protein n=1 Tax=Ascidiimonas aurantiaca TaxID=1685432 RepID=UPI0030EBDE24